MKRVRALVLSLIMATMILGSSLTVFAETFTLQGYIDKMGGTGNISSANIADSMLDNTYESIRMPDGLIKYVNAAGVDEAKAHWNQIQASNDNTEHIKNQISALDDGINPDLSGAAGIFVGFMDTINLFLGVVITILTTGMTIFTAIDLCYIIFPAFRGRCEDMKTDGKGVDHNRTNKSGSTKLWFISDEAEYAINSANTRETGKNPVVIYGKKRAVAIIVLSVAIFILLTGNLSVITDIAVRLASGIIELIGKMGS